MSCLNVTCNNYVRVIELNSNPERLKSQTKFSDRQYITHYIAARGTEWYQVDAVM